jgi:hypothetical protein
MLFIKKSYKDLTNPILGEASSHGFDEEDQLLLPGTSGIGKSFFIRYFVWRLLHPLPAVDAPGNHFLIS